MIDENLLLKALELREEKHNADYELFTDLPDSQVVIGNCLQELQEIIELINEQYKTGEWITTCNPPKIKGRYLVCVERNNEKFVDIDYFNGKYFCWGDYVKVWQELPKTI